MKVKILGTGGAFDVEEKNSSFLINFYSTNFLVDCGESVFKTLKEQNLIDEISIVCLSHLHSDHSGSLSTLIYYNFFILKKITKILTTPQIARDLKFLLTLIGHEDNQYEIITKDPHVTPWRTYGHHMANYETCGFIFHEHAGANKLIISGDTGVSEDHFVQNFGCLDDDPIVFHDASTFNSPVHCYYKNLDKNNKNLYLYHHSAAARNQMTDEGYQCLTPGHEIEL